MTYGYVRVSTEKQRDNLSSEAQRILVEKFAKAQGDTFRVYEEVKSGKNIKERPVFRKLLEDLKTENYPVKRFWVVELTRLARHVGEADDLSRFFRKHHVEVYELDKPVNLDYAGERLNYGIKSVVAAHEREITGERIRRAKKVSADKGAYKHSALLGYSRLFNTEDGTSIWRIDEDEAKTVRKIFSDYLNGISVNRIATELNRLGYRTKRNKHFEAVTVAKLLNHPYYFGLGYDSDGNLIPSTVYHAILPFSREEFLKAREKREPQAAKFKYIRKDVSGLIVCKRCGARYYVHRKVNKGTEYFYLAHQSDLGIPCDQIPKYIPLEKHAMRLLEVYEESLRDLECLGRLMMREELDRPNIKNLEDESNRLKRELERLHRRKDKLMEAIEDGNLTTEEVRERVKKINSEIERYSKLNLEVIQQLKRIYDPSEVTEVEAEKRLEAFRAKSVGDRNLALKQLIKSCEIDGPTVTLQRFDRQVFQWDARGEIRDSETVSDSSDSANSKLSSSPTITAARLGS